MHLIPVIKYKISARKVDDMSELTNPDGMSKIISLKTHKTHTHPHTLTHTHTHAHMLSHHDMSIWGSKPVNIIRIIPSIIYCRREGGSNIRIPMYVSRGSSENSYSDITPCPIYTFPVIVTTLLEHNMIKLNDL